MAVNNAINLTVTGAVTADGSGGFTGSALTDNTVVRGSTSNTLQDSTITVSDAGEMVNTSQPCFSAYLGSDLANVTGDGTTYTIGTTTALTEFFDQGSDFVTSGTYTAPVSGKHLFQMNVRAEGLSSGHTQGDEKIVTSNNTFAGNVVNPYAIRNVGAPATSLDLEVICEMDASDSTTFQYRVSGSTKTVNAGGEGSFINTMVSGVLLC